MKTFWTVIIVVVVVVVGALLWWGFSGTSASLTGYGSPSGTSTSTASTAVPGDNLALGQDSSASLGAYLIGYNGMTLYTYSPDTAGVSTCTGACATAWPPYTVTSAASLVAESPISGSISTLTRADGTLQLTYNGHPLYFYAGDSVSGDTNGQGKGGVWYVAKP